MSNPETIQSTRQEWDKISNEVQDDINSYLDRLSIDIEAANLKLADVAKNDPANYRQFSAEIIEGFNSIWPCVDDVFMVSGRWYMPECTVAMNGFTLEYVKKEAFGSATSKGFNAMFIKNKDGKVEPRIGMSFSVGQLTLDETSSIMKREIDLFAFAELSEISMQFMKFAKNNMASADLTEAVNVLNRAEALLDLHTNHQDSNFYQQSQSKQEKFFQSLIDMVEDNLPAPDSFDKFCVNELKTPLVFMKEADGRGVMSLSSPSAKVPLNITGQVVGVTIHDLVHDGRAKKYTSPDELSASKLGMSLIVKPRAANFKLNACGGRDLLIPLRKITSYSMQID